MESLTAASNASTNYKKQAGDFVDPSFSYAMTYDKRNQKFQTTDGFVSKFNQSLPLNTDDNASILNGYEFRSFHELIPEVITNFNFYARAVNAISNEDVRVSKRLHMPGKRLRGFQSGKVGPKDNDDYVGGNYVTAVNVISTLPKLFPELQNTDFNIFFDAGNVWGVDYDSSLDNASKIRSAVGIGVDWYTPIGPLNFSLAQPITKSSSDKLQRFRFNLWTRF